MLVAIAREGEVLQGSPREVVISAGDTLLLECSSPSGKNDFARYNLLDMETTSLYKPDMRTLYSSLIMIAMVAVSSLGYLSLLQAAFVAAFAMIICRFCTIRQARESIDWSLLMIFAGSISLGTAIEETGIAEWISGGILDLKIAPRGNPSPASRKRLDDDFITPPGICFHIDDKPRENP